MAELPRRPQLPCLATTSSLANGALLAGHAVVQDRAFISGNCLVHQFCRVGTLALMQGGSAISQDLPPFTMAHRVNELCGLNVVGLRRAGFHGGTAAGIETDLPLAFSQREKFAGGNRRSAKKIHQPRGENLAGFCRRSKTRRVRGCRSCERRKRGRIERRAMYKIIGADGREYGPATAGQLRQWIAEGRANAQTQTLAPGAPEWKPLGALPEFAGHFAPPIPPVIGPPRPGTSTAGQLPKTNSFATAGTDFRHLVG